MIVGGKGLMNSYICHLSISIGKPKKAITITLPDGSVKAGTSWVTTPYDIAASIAQGLADSSVVAKVWKCGGIQELSFSNVHLTPCLLISSRSSILKLSIPLSWVCFVQKMGLMQKEAAPPPILKKVMIVPPLSASSRRRTLAHSHILYIHTQHSWC